MFKSAAEFARECGVDRSTVLRWIKLGKVKTKNKAKPKGSHYKIPESQAKLIKQLKKPYPKWQKCWSRAEENLILLSPHLKNKQIAEIIGRSYGSVRVHKTHMRRRGLL